tara:strand:+ start:302 stop:436 length:135 start_codon:yes stop_codon:yes gene_type:complete
LDFTNDGEDNVLPKYNVKKNSLACGTPWNPRKDCQAVTAHALLS